MREARIIAVAEHEKARALLEHMLLGTFGGFTRSETFGAWREVLPDGTSRDHIEAGFAYDIACEPTEASLVRLESVARVYAKEAKQICVYLRTPSGAVVFVEPEKQEVAA